MMSSPVATPTPTVPTAAPARTLALKLPTGQIVTHPPSPYFQDYPALVAYAQAQGYAGADQGIEGYLQADFSFLSRHEAKVSDDEPPRVATAALKIPTASGWQVFTLPRPARHVDLMREAERAGFTLSDRVRKGFLLSNGEFANRKWAKCCARYHDQLLETAEAHDELMTDEIW